MLALHEGRAKGRSWVSREWMRAATTPDRKPIEYGSLFEGSRLGYGYSWWLLKDFGFMAQGVFGQFLFVDPRTEVVIVKFGAWDAPWDDALELETYAFFEGVVNALASRGERR